MKHVTQSVWHGTRKALLVELGKVFNGSTPSQQLFRMLAEYLVQQWLMYDPTIDDGSYVPVPVTWSKASASLGRLPTRLPPGGALHVVETEGAPWFDVRPQGKVVFVSLKLAPFQRSRGQRIQHGVEPDPTADTWQWSLSDLHLLMEHLWPGESHEAQFARTAVKFLVEEGTQEHRLAAGTSCWVAIPVRLYTVIRATSHLQMDGEKRITLLLRLGGDNVVVRRGPDGEDKLLQLHMGQLTVAFRKHFPSRAKTIPRNPIASSSPSPSASGSPQSPSPVLRNSFAAVAASGTTAAHMNETGCHAASRAASVRSVPSNGSASPSAAKAAVLGHALDGQLLQAQCTGSTSGEYCEEQATLEQLTAASSAVLRACSPPGTVAGCPSVVTQPSRISRGGMSGSFTSHIGGSTTSSFAGSPPSAYGVPATTLGVAGANGLHKATALPLTADLTLPSTTSLASNQQAAPLRTLSQSSLLFGHSLSSPNLSLNPLQLPHAITNSTSSFTSAYAGNTPGPTTPDANTICDAWLPRSMSGAAGIPALLGLSNLVEHAGVPLAPPQLEQVKGSGPQISLVQRMQNNSCTTCAIRCETSGTGLSMQLAVLMVYIPKPHPVCLLMDAADIIPGGWLHTELQLLLQYPGLTKVLHDGQLLMQALGTVQLLLGPSVVDTKVMQAVLREMVRQTGETANLPIEAPRQLHKLLQQYGWVHDDALTTSHEDPAVWAQRPLPNKLVEYSARQLALLPQLAVALQRDLVTVVTGPWLAAASLAYSQGHPKDLFAQEILRCW